LLHHGSGQFLQSSPWVIGELWSLHQRQRKRRFRTRRDTTTATSRLVGGVRRGLNLNPRFGVRSRW
jgi:hypothetical protein